MTRGKAYAAEIRRREREGYKRYVRGLRLLDAVERPETKLDPVTRDDYETARDALEMLRGSVIGAGSNEWRRHKDRYEQARARFRTFPVPCEATLWKVSEPCQRLGFDNRPVCKACYENILACARKTGMLLDEHEGSE